MLFNLRKCICIQICNENVNKDYFMGEPRLGTSVKEMNLDITLSVDRTVSDQCGLAASKGNQIVGLIRRHITYTVNNLIIPLYKHNS